jgi:hypothetical protein
MQRWHWLLIPPLTVAGALSIHLLTAAAFRRRTEALVAKLGGPAFNNEPAPTPPAVVRSFLQRTTLGGAVPSTIRLRQRAEMRANPGEPWQQHTAGQTISVHDPGFVWLARVQLAPLLSACILDSYVNGEGLLEVRLLGSLRLARATGPQVSRGELMRYLAELAWAPHAMLHNPRLRWREIDATTVEVSVDSADGPTRVRLVFEGGDLARIEADDRPRVMGRGTVLTGWRGRFFDYREMGGCRIPTRAEVSWLLPEGPFTCWRGEVTAFQTVR